MKSKTAYMAYNHNGIELLKEATTKAKAEREAREYRYATGNAAYAEQLRELNYCELGE